MAISGGLLLTLYATVIEPDRLRLTLVRRAATRSGEPRRFLLLSDLHLRPFSFRTFRRIQRAARWAGGLGTRHVLIAGDLLEDDREAAVVGERLRHALGSLDAMYVSGNHEAMRTNQRWPFKDNDPEAVEAGLAAHRIERIDGRVVELEGIPVLGIGRPGRTVGAPASALADISRLDRPALVLAHSPDHVRGLPPARVLLALCGHTHGGQVRLPVVGAPWIPVRAPLPRFAGAMILDGVATYVSRGIGATIPVRLGAVPEATLIEIV